MRLGSSGGARVNNARESDRFKWKKVITGKPYFLASPRWSYYIKKKKRKETLVLCTNGAYVWYSVGSCVYISLASI